MRTSEKLLGYGKVLLLGSATAFTSARAQEAAAVVNGVESTVYDAWMDSGTRVSYSPYDINGGIAAGSRVGLYDTKSSNQVSGNYVVSGWRNASGAGTPRGSYAARKTVNEQLGANYNFPPSLGRAFSVLEGSGPAPNTANGAITFVVGTGATLSTTASPDIGEIPFVKEVILEGTTTAPASNALPGEVGTTRIDMSAFPLAQNGIPVKVRFSYDFTSQTAVAPFSLDRELVGQADTDNNGSYETTLKGYFISGHPLHLVGNTGTIIVSGLSSAFSNSTTSFPNTADYEFNYTAGSSSVGDWSMFDDEVTRTAPSLLMQHPGR